MKVFLYILNLLMGVPFMVYAQPALQAELNLLRPGDKIVKQQVGYKDPGRVGKDVVWDFGNLQAVNEEYKLAYIEPRLRRNNSYVLGKDTFYKADGLVIGREHNTNYFYQFHDNKLFLLGYENHTDLMHYVTPLPVVKFPFRYGQKIEQEVRSENLFSSKVPMYTYGKVSIEADACGMMVLPTRDTLKHVLRIHSVQTQLKDSTKVMDSIHVNTTIETYKWYAVGYRYPVFEIIKTIHKSDKAEDVFETAFFFPPQKQYFLPEDAKNIAALDSLQYIEKVGSNSSEQWKGLRYNIMPNPVRTEMLFELYLPRSVNNLRIQISDLIGVVYINEMKGSYPEGISRIAFNVSELPVGNYTLNFWLDGYPVHGSVIMKR